MESFCLRLFLIDSKKLTWRALGWFTCGNLKEVLSKLIGNWSGELLVHLHMESLRNPFQNQLDCFWRAPDHFIYGTLKGNHFKIKAKLVRNAHGQFVYGILKKFLAKPIGK